MAGFDYYYQGSTVPCLGFVAPKPTEDWGKYTESIKPAITMLAQNYRRIWVNDKDSSKSGCVLPDSFMTRESNLTLIKDIDFDNHLRLCRTKTAGTAENRLLAGGPCQLIREIRSGESISQEVYFLENGSYVLFITVRCAKVRPFSCTLKIGVDGNIIAEDAVNPVFTRIYQSEISVRKGKHIVNIACSADRLERKSIPLHLGELKNLNSRTAASDKMK